MTFLGMPQAGATIQLNSEEDASVNFVEAMGPMEALEARFVRRSEGYIVAYISPQTACAQACRFCHLTATGQVKGRDATREEIKAQASQVLSYFAGQVRAGVQPAAPVVHYNFMARGEALASATILEDGRGVMEDLFSLAKAHGMTPAVKISTIGTDKISNLLDVFPYEQPDIYYSLYSMDPAFRRKWLPKAPEPLAFLKVLKDWQDVTHKIPTLHQAAIEGENSSPETAEKIIQAVNGVGLAVNVNIVRYNPPTPRHGVEPVEEVLDSHVALYREAWPNMRAKVVTKVGHDVAASCGMFVGGRKPAGMKNP